MFEEDSLFTPMESSRSTEVSGSQFFINFLNQLEVGRLSVRTCIGHT